MPFDAVRDMIVYAIPCLCACGCSKPVLLRSVTVTVEDSVPIPTTVKCYDCRDREHIHSQPAY